ncbi:hypothetical protein MK079_01945 [Candidatus Gracilibacteria bacterium]|nr:hypothetical protein [Candidatus Gracilibacteria bacterium]
MKYINCLIKIVGHLQIRDKQKGYAQWYARSFSSVRCCLDYDYYIDRIRVYENKKISLFQAEQGVWFQIKGFFIKACPFG